MKRDAMKRLLLDRLIAVAGDLAVAQRERAANEEFAVNADKLLEAAKKRIRSLENDLAELRNQGRTARDPET